MSLNQQRATIIAQSYGIDIEKGSKANIGEVREWSGKKFQKQANGEWKEVSEGANKEKLEEPKKVSSLKNLKIGQELVFKYSGKNEIKGVVEEKEKESDGTYSIKMKFHDIAVIGRGEEDHYYFEEGDRELKDLYLGSSSELKSKENSNKAKEHKNNPNNIFSLKKGDKLTYRDSVHTEGSSGETYTFDHYFPDKSSGKRPDTIYAKNDKTGETKMFSHYSGKMYNLVPFEKEHSSMDGMSPIKKHKDKLNEERFGIFSVNEGDSVVKYDDNMRPTKEGKIIKIARDKNGLMTDFWLEGKTPSDSSVHVPIGQWNYKETFHWEKSPSSNIQKSEYTKDQLNELVDEHENLIDVMESPSEEDDKKEITKQKKELKGYKEELSKSEAYEILGIDDFEADSFLEKGHKANIGEVREWKGNKYQKGTDGWKRLKNIKKWTEEFVDEDTGEIVSIDREEDLDAPEKPKKTSASQKRRERKADKKEDELRDKYFDAEAKLKEEVSELKYLKKQRASINQEMEEEAGQKGNSWSDDDGNRYGDQLNEIEKEIEKQEKVIAEVKKLVNLASSNYQRYKPESRYEPKNLTKAEAYEILGL